jgi:hypothetical protein
MSDEITVYTGPKNKSLALHPYMKFVGELPPYLLKARQDSAKFDNYFVSLEEFAQRPPPGSLPRIEVVPDEPEAKRGTPIKFRGSMKKLGNIFQ